MRFYNFRSLSLLLFFQALIIQQSSVGAQRASSVDQVEVLSQGATDQPSSQQERPLQAPPESTVVGPDISLEFTETTFSIAREGYVSLEWNTPEGAVSYEVTDAQQRSQYRGDFPAAFISGLSDGRHKFTVVAFDAEGHQLAISRQPAELEVAHWPKSQAFILFGLGLLVFLAIISVLVIGSVRNSDHSQSPAASTMEHQ